MRSSISLHPTPSTSEARTAFETCEPQLLALDPLEVEVPRVNVQRAAAVAHSIAVRDQNPARITAFEQLGSIGLYDRDRPTRIATLSLATWFIRQQQLGHRVLNSNATVPQDVLRAAQLLRRRMLSVLEYWLRDDERLMAEVAAIRAGTGYQDLANDLERLADLHQRPAVIAEIQRDTKYVQPDDVEQARSLARSIFSALGLGSENELQRWTDLCQRAWTLLNREYELHRAAGAFLMRSLEDVDETYPSLVAAARTPRSRRTATEDDEVEDDDPSLFDAEDAEDAKEAAQ